MESKAKRKIRTSLVMSCYNGEKFLNAQLNSIANQTKVLDEIIFVDDCSCDATLEMLNTFIKKTNIECKLLIHDQNRGYKNSFLEAITNTTGDVVFLADQDDVWHLNKVERLTELLDENSDITCINTDYSLIDGAGKQIKQRKIFDRNRYKSKGCLTKIGIDYLLKYNVSMGCTLAFKKCIVEELRKNLQFYYKENLTHDWIINLISAAKNGAYYLDEELIDYRIHNNNTIGFKRASQIDSRVKAYILALEEHKSIKNILNNISRSDLESIIDAVIYSYEVRIDCLKKQSIAAYMKEIAKRNILRYSSVKTAGYDVILMVKRFKKC